MRSMRRPWRMLVAAALAALLLAAPAPAAARVVITVQVAYGSVVVGGVGFFLFFAGSWEVPFVPRDLPTSLVDVQGSRVRLGVPLPSLCLDAGDAGSPEAEARMQLELLRWRF